MLQLVCNIDSHLYPDLVLRPGTSLGFGRKASHPHVERTQVIKEAKISSHHCTVFVDAAGRASLTDYSTNGTFVNGERTATVALKAGDVITFGTPPAGATMVLLPSYTIELCGRTQSDELRDKVDLYALVIEGKHPMPADLTLKVAGAPALHFAVHRAVVGAASPLIARMLSSGMREEASGSATLTLPAGTESLMGDFLYFCYNRTLRLGALVGTPGGEVGGEAGGESTAAVDLWRLCDFLGCDTLANLLRTEMLQARADVSTFVARVHRALDFADERILSVLLSAMPEDLEPWFDADSAALVDALLRAARQVDVGDAARLLELVATEVGPRWVDLPAVAALTHGHFALLLSMIAPGALPEQQLCDLVLSYIDRNGLPFEGDVAAALLQVVDAKLLPAHYTASQLATRMPMHSIFADMISAHPPVCCPITRRLMVEPLRLPCGHVFEKAAIEQRVDLARQPNHITCPSFLCAAAFSTAGRGPAQRRNVVKGGTVDASAVEAYLVRKADKRKALREWGLTRGGEASEAAAAVNPAKRQRTAAELPEGHIIIGLIDHTSHEPRYSGSAGPSYWPAEGPSGESTSAPDFTTVVTDCNLTVREALMIPYCEARGLGSSGSDTWPHLTCRLVFRGRTVNSTSTCEDLDLESGDVFELCMERWW